MEYRQELFENLRRVGCKLQEFIHLNGTSMGMEVYPLIFLRILDNLLSRKAIDMRKFYEKENQHLPAKELEDGLKAISELPFYNISGYTLSDITKDGNTAFKLLNYIEGFNDEVRQIFALFDINHSISVLNSKNILKGALNIILSFNIGNESITGDEYRLIIEYFTEQLTLTMGKEFGEMSTPHDISELMAAILTSPYYRSLARRRYASSASIYDPTCGTAGTLYAVKDALTSQFSSRDVMVYGQDINPRNAAVAKILSLLTVGTTDNIQLGDTLTADKFEGRKFDYVVANFPFNMAITHDQDLFSFDPKYSIASSKNGNVYFVQNILDHMNETGKACFVAPMSSLTAGDFGSGENSLRRYIIENDLLDCVVALPSKMFPSTNISTCLWVLSKQKRVSNRKGRVFLIDARDMFSTDSAKRNILTNGAINKIVSLYQNYSNTKISKRVYNSDLGELLLSVNQPQRDYDGEIIFKDGEKVANKDKQITEVAPLSVDANHYFEERILPNVDEESWINFSGTRIGYKIRFNDFFKKDQEEISSSQALDALDKSRKRVNTLNQNLVECQNNLKDIQHVEGKEIRLKFVSTIQSGTQVSPQNFIIDGGAYLLWVSTIENGKINFQKCKQITEETMIKKKCVILQEGDIVISTTGTVGKVVVIPKSDKPIVMGKGLVRVQLLDNNIDSKYLSLVLDSPIFQKFVSDNSKSTGMPYLSNKILGEFSFILPSLTVQNQLINSVGRYNDLVRQLEFALSEEQIAAKAYRNALLKKLLTTEDKN